MRVTFEKADIVMMLRQVLGYDIKDDDVVIQAEPFEVQISHVNVDKLAQTSAIEAQQELVSALLVKNPASPPFVEDPSEDKKPEPAKEGGDIFTMADMLAQNAAMATDSPRLSSPSVSGEGRTLGPLETEEPPPLMESELFGSKEGT